MKLWDRYINCQDIFPGERLPHTPYIYYLLTEYTDTDQPQYYIPHNIYITPTDCTYPSLDINTRRPQTKQHLIDVFYLVRGAFIVKIK